MSTQKRIDSSRANGAKSRGPVTPEGRARSRAASLTHGLASDMVVLSYESEEEFKALRDEYFAEYQPQTRPQVDLVDQLVAARWRLNRVISLQGALMELQMDSQKPEIEEEFVSCSGEIRAAIAYQHLCDDSRALESLHRHEARLSAELRRTLKLLDAQLKNQKLHPEPSDAQPPRSDEDAPTIDHRPSTIDPRGAAGDERRSPIDPLGAPSDERAETPPSTIGHPPSTIDPREEPQATSV